MNVLGLFSGIGGFELGLERAGMTISAMCESDEDCRKVLKKHWPNVPIYNDVRKLNGKDFDIDIICGGYPCVGHSVAGKKDGFKNEKSALWREYARIIRGASPKYCIVENSPNLRNTGMVKVLEDCWAIGYNAEWSVLSAYSVGSPHQRERLFVVLWRRDVSYPDPFRLWAADLEKEKTSSWWWPKRRIKRNAAFKKIREIKSSVRFNVDGLPRDVARGEEEKIKQLGNAVVPQIPELIGRALIEHEEKTNESIQGF